MSTDNPRFATEEFLDPYIESARQQFDAAQIEHAAQRLRERLPPVRVAQRAIFGWLPLASAASILVVALTVMSIFLPGENSSAFAQAQQWFSSFRTLQVEMTVQEGQNTITIGNVWLNDTGDLRIESGETTIIARSEAGMAYILLPDGQTITQSIPPDSAMEEYTEWLAELRDFQGEADLLDEPRLIEGISATGYSLTIGASTFVLWVDPVDSKPLLVEVETPAGATTRIALSFDMALPTDAFDVPGNTQPLEPHN